MICALLTAIFLPSSLDFQRDQSTNIVNIFQCSFDDRWDKNYDRWPDRWERQHGPKFPRYVKIGIENDNSAHLGTCLKIHLNGGAAMVSSPSIPVNPLFSYRIDARVNAGGLIRDDAFIVTEFYDDENNKLQEVRTKSYKDTSGWENVTIGPLVLHDEKITHAIIRLKITHGKRSDLKGFVAFDNLRLSRLPRIVVMTNKPFNVFTDPENVEIVCEISGIHKQNPVMQFELLDDSSHEINNKSEALNGRLIEQKSAKASELLGVDNKIPDGYVGKASWKLPLESNDYGFYRVRVTMLNSSNKNVVEKWLPFLKDDRWGISKRINSFFGDDRKLMQENVSLAIAQELPESSHGIYGWSLAHGDKPLPMESLAKFLPQVGIHWVKVPVWYPEQDDEYGNRILRFAEHLATSGIDLVGVIDHPPENSGNSKLHDENLAISDILSLEPSNWLPMLDPIMTRLSLRVRWWQLGADHDTSFVGYPNVDKKIIEIRNQLYRFGQDVNLGISWRWIEEAIDSESWQFLQYDADPALTGAELESYLQDLKDSTVFRWVLIQPLPKNKYSLESRAHDLVAQMMAAKINKADAAFVPNPFDNENGLMKEDGTPGELLLPWRTTATLLGGSTHLGQIVMPNGSNNRIFLHKDGTTIMVLWSDHPVKENIYLGDEVRQFDIWGRETPLKQDEYRQIIEVGSMPVFLVGLSEPVARLRMSTEFKTYRIPSIYGLQHPNVLKLKNDFPQGGGGTITMETEDKWSFNPQRIPFKAAANEEVKIPFRITLPNDSSSGIRRVKINYNFTIDKQYKFSVYRELEVGLGDIQVDVHPYFEGDTLIVEQHLKNNSTKYVNFKSYLYIRGEVTRRRQERSVFRLGPGVDIQQFRYPNARDLVGHQLWLNIKEMGEGDRVLNKRFTVGE